MGDAASDPPLDAKKRTLSRPRYSTHRNAYQALYFIFIFRTHRCKSLSVDSCTHLSGFPSTRELLRSDTVIAMTSISGATGCKDRSKRTGKSTTHQPLRGTPCTCIIATNQAIPSYFGITKTGSRYNLSGPIRWPNVVRACCCVFAYILCVPAV